jgi:hypothetical protein
MAAPTIQQAVPDINPPRGKSYTLVERLIVFNAPIEEKSIGVTNLKTAESDV